MYATFDDRTHGKGSHVCATQTVDWKSFERSVLPGGERHE